jgi:hypothetical protein
MQTAVDFDKTCAVDDFVRTKFRLLFARADDRWLQKLFGQFDDFFAGRTTDYAPIDLHYHNLRHTLMATGCMADLLEGINATEGVAHLSSRDFELAIAAVLLHDSGYLKLRSDTEGTGAKYTYCHITRSCAFAASYLPQLGVTVTETENVISAINCTGPYSEIHRLKFSDEAGRTLGCALATSDYVGQLSDPHYPDKLSELYQEFCESDTYSNVPTERRMFKSECDLVLRTPAFWRNFVRPKLEKDFDSVYRYLARPVGSTSNAYMDAIEANFAKIEQRIAAMAPPSRS